MRRSVTFLIGLAAALLMGWVWHGPAGNGAALVAQLETQARSAVAKSGLAGVQLSLGRNPLSRTATISGEANDLQREGLGSGWGVKDYARTVPGVGPVRWSDEAPGSGLPLLAELLLLVGLAYLAGFGLGWLFFGRRRRESFLD